MQSSIASLLKNKNLLLPVLHVLLLYLVYELMVLVFGLDRTTLFFFKQWDAKWYADIAEHGYLYSTEAPSNSGFFPLFPFLWKILWKITGAGVPGVCLMNLFFYVGGLLVLQNTFRFSGTKLLFFMSLPSVFFAYVPYTEATYFFFCALLLKGVRENKTAIIYASVFFATLIRPTSLFLIPAFAAVELFSPEPLILRLKRVIKYSVPALASLALIALIQYRSTGVVFAYFKAQSKFWSHSFQQPQLPFTTWSGPPVLWLDGLALFFGLLAIILLVALLLEHRKKKQWSADNATVFSISYIAISILYVMFFNGTDDDGGTSLMGLNRYIIATPFLPMLLLFVAEVTGRSRWFILLYIVLTCICINLLNFNSVTFFDYDLHEKTFYIVLTTINILSYLLFSDRFKGQFILFLYLINAVLQLFLLYRFSLQYWVG